MIGRRSIWLLFHAWGEKVFRMRKYYYIIGIIILIVILRRIDFHKVFIYYSKLNLTHFGLISLIILPTIFFKAYRWMYLLRLQGINYSITNSFLAYLGGIFAGIITPGRVGEAIKAMYLKTDKDVPFSEGMVSVILDRLFDLCLIVILVCLGFWFFLNFKTSKFSIPITLFSSLLLFVPFVLLNKIVLEKVAKIIYEVTISRIDKSILDSQFKNFLSIIKRIMARRVYVAFILTIFSALCYFWQCYLLARLMSLDISFITVVFFISTTTLLSLLPITIFGFGTREASLIYCFSFVGLNAESAVSYSFLLFTSFYLISGIFSFLGWMLKGYYGPNILKQQG